MNEPYYYVALCVIKQTGDDDDPSVKRDVVSAEVIAPPSYLPAAREAFSQWQQLAVAAQRFKRG